MNTNAATHPVGTWAEQTVDMPGMGPGANKAGWWVSYLNELMMTGKYEDVLKYLSQARQTGAIFAIVKAKEEMNREYVSAKKKDKTSTTNARVLMEANHFRTLKKCTNNSKKHCRRFAPAEEKDEPYFDHAQGKVA